MSFDEWWENHRPEHKWNDWDLDSLEWHYEITKAAYQAGQQDQREKDARIADEKYSYTSMIIAKEIAKAIRSQDD